MLIRISKKITDATIINALAAPTFVKNEKAEIEDTRAKPPIVKKVTIKNRLDEMNFTESGIIDIRGRFALLLYSEIIHVSLVISSNIPHISPKDFPTWLENLYKYFPSQYNLRIYPQIITMQKGDSLNLFAKISILKDSKESPIENGILNFLRDSFFILRGRTSTNKFFIKELEGFNDFSEVLDKDDSLKAKLNSQNLKKKQITLQNVFIETSMDFINGDYTSIKLSFEFNGKPWILYYKRQDLELQRPNNSKAQSLWHFEQNSAGHGKNLKSSNLSYLAQLTPAEYYAQLPVIKEMFHREKTNFQIKEPAKTLSLKNFIIKLKPDDIQKEMRPAPAINTKQWREFEQEDNQAKLRQKLKDKTQLELRLEQQFRLQMNLKRLKESLINLKGKLSMLKIRLEQLEIKLNH